MQPTTLSAFLRRVLLIDAATSIACGLLLAGAAGPLTDLLGLPAALLRGAGLGLLPIAAFILFVATRAAVPRLLVWLVIAGNVIWAIDSLALLATPWVAPTLLGSAFVIGQAAIVAILARAEHLGLRGSPALA